MANFFYDKQIKRFLGQIISVFSYFDVEYGEDDSGNTVYRRVPVKYATNEKMSASIIRNNSENTMNSVPSMSVYITGLEYDRERIQNPTFVDKKNIREKRYNQDTGEYSSKAGNFLTVERHMPVPYKLSFNVDIWTSNTEQKLQLLEQILVLFNPDFEIQNTDNYLDWTSLSYMHIDNINYSSRTIPAGTEETLDIATLSFYCPIWLSAPAKVKKLGVVEKIVSGIYNAGDQFNDGVIDSVDSLGEKIYTTPTGYNLIVLNNQATIYPVEYGINSNAESTAEVVGEPVSWETFVSYFGKFKNGITQLRLRKNNTSTEIVGTVTISPADPFTLLFNVDQDTVPGNSLRPVDAIIDPTRSAPDINNLPAAAAGQRYLILEAINGGKQYSNPMDGADAWKNGSEDFFANQYDIIEYTGTEWQVSWSSADNASSVEHITNLKTGLQYQWTGENWINSWEGEYSEGSWSLVL